MGKTGGLCEVRRRGYGEGQSEREKKREEEEDGEGLGDGVAARALPGPPPRRRDGRHAPAPEDDGTLAGGADRRGIRWQSPDIVGNIPAATAAS